MSLPDVFTTTPWRCCLFVEPIVHAVFSVVWSNMRMSTPYLLLMALLLVPSLAKALQLKLAPLIGGPSWLPLHVKVVVEDSHTWDFVPLNATSPSTLQSLLRLQSVPGEIRHYRQGRDTTAAASSPRIQRAQAFVDAYTNRDLNLIQNNCWTFALMLYWHLLRETEETDGSLS